MTKSSVVIVIGVLAAIMICQGTDAAKPPLFELNTMDGEAYKLKDELGKKVIILDFWATWCKPCLREMPHINEIYEKYKDQGLVVYAINVDNASAKSRVKPTIRRKNFTLPVLMDPSSEVLRKYNPTKNIPYLTIIGADGETVRDFSGFKPGDQEIVERIVKEELQKLNSEKETVDPSGMDQDTEESMEKVEPEMMNDGSKTDKE